ncbi:MAG TPA: S41 family peptidase [Prolixibacteraceae bacterium]|nr:S41 family peptidase [Prolixibacteraceae bacterium]HPS11810.1 S41 family peptidase [Prolixibacteraceae bacterium]
MKKKLNKKLIVVVSAIVVAGFMFMGLNNIDNKNFEIAKNLDIYYSLFRELNTFYVDEVDPGKLVKESIDDMLASLDPYTNYIAESDIEDFKFMTTGEYGGIGALISKHGEDIIISEPYENFPAQKSGLRAGDVLLEVSGKSTKGMTTENVSDLLKGTVGQAIQVKIKRYGEKKPLDITIVREKIVIDPISYSGMIDSTTGYIYLSSFTKDCADKVKKAFFELKGNGAQKIVLDLRGNPGGLLIESVNLCNIFIPKDHEVVSTKGKVSEWDKTYKTMFEPVDTMIPLAVLVNRGSASASEIVSGTMQDLDRAVIIGSRTFGKGLVQTTRDLSYNTKLKVTTAKYYIPSGRCIQALDYSHRNEDGSVGHVPDSLISEFSTKNGRKVYDGGGVVPDVKTDDQELSNLSASLIKQFKIFDFATKFRAENETIPSVKNFKITDKMYDDFIAYVEGSNFTYTSETQEVLKQLKESAKSEKYLDLAGDQIDKLEKTLSPDLDRDLKKFREEISDLLRDEIVTRYYYQKGSAQAAIENDLEVKKAIEILANKDEYRKILNLK